MQTSPNEKNKCFTLSDTKIDVLELKCQPKWFLIDKITRPWIGMLQKFEYLFPDLISILTHVPKLYALKLPFYQSGPSWTE